MSIPFLHIILKTFLPFLDILSYIPSVKIIPKKTFSIIAFPSFLCYNYSMGEKDLEALPQTPPENLLKKVLWTL